MDYKSILTGLKPSREFFIGIDSDGCVFDTMEVKHKEFFIPNTIKYFNLFAISKLVRETWEFVNLYSIDRGVNRFPALIKVFELLAERVEIKRAGYKLQDLSTLKTWISNETRLSNATLKKFFGENNDKSLELVIKWTEAVNEDISRWLQDVPPFPNAQKSIEYISSFADTVVVSQTPVEALEREWNEHNLKKYVRVIAGQEYGTKTEHITMAAKGKYPDEKILMIGDAKGDYKAAKNNGILFFPINPGSEDKSWENLLNEGLHRFRSGTFAGNYETNLLKEFLKSLPDLPPWDR